MRIKKGDSVIVLSGKDRGRTGQVLRAMPSDDRVVVEGVNVAKRHTKARKAGDQAEIKEIEMPLHVSNVALLGSDGKAVKVGYKVADGKKVRVDKATGAEV